MRDHLQDGAIWLAERVWRWEVVGWIVAALIAAWGVMLSLNQFVLADVFFVIAASMVFARVLTWEELRQEAYSRRITVTVITSVALLGIVFAELRWVRQKERAENTDVTATFVYPTEPALVLVNSSGQVAREIKYWVTVWNMDKPSTPNNPSPIPTAAFDYIRPHESSGPEQLFTAAMKSSLTHGNRLFGYAGVTCPNCVRTRLFWVYIVWGVGGWFAEIPTGQIDWVALFSEMPQIEKSPDTFLQSIPTKDRVPIQVLQ